MPQTIRFITTFLLCSLIAISSVFGQNNSESKPTIKVGLCISEPFVIEDNEVFDGMAIELWEHIAEEQNINYEYTTFKTFKSLISATQKGSINLAISNLSITEDRAKLIDFTHPWYDGGLRIMTTEDGNASSWDVLTELKDTGHVKAYLWLIAVILIVTIGLTLFDRKFDKEFPSKWREGIAESFYTVMSVATSGSLKRKNLFGWIGKILSAFWLVIGIIVIAYITSSITSVMTSLTISNEINNINDLDSKTIGVVEGRVSEDFVKLKGLNYISYMSLEETVTALENDEISAIIGDSPILEYYTFKNQGKALKIVGKIYNPDKYGFGLPINDSLTKQLTLGILKAQEDGLIDELRVKYFGYGS